MSEEQILAFVLVITRVTTFVAFFTLFSFRQLPVLIKIGMSVSLSLFWIGETQYADLPSLRALGMIESVILLVREFGIGLMLCVALNLFLMPCKVAGAYAGQEMGLSLASLSNPGTPDSATLVTRVFETFTVLIFFALNLHHFLIMAIDFSFQHITHNFDLVYFPTEQLVGMLNDSSNYGLMVIAPLALILMVVTLSLALLNRAAPTLNLFSVGIGFRAGFGIFCLALLAPVLFGAMRGYLYRVQSDVEQFLMLFQG